MKQSMPTELKLLKLVCFLAVFCFVAILPSGIFLNRAALRPPVISLWNIPAIHITSDAQAQEVSTSTAEPAPEERQLPQVIQHRLDTYSTLKKVCLILYWTFGVLAVLGSSLAATNIPDPWRSAAAITSVVCLALLAFIHPREQYDRFWGAWSKVDTVARQYQLNQATAVQLNASVDDAENFLAAQPWPTPQLPGEKASKVPKATPSAS